MKLCSLIGLGKEVENAQEAAFDLWSWLPSCVVAKAHHGDCYAEVTPELGDVMIEAALFFAHRNRVAFQGGEIDFTEEEKEWFERCPCGENHDIVVLPIPEPC